MHRILVVDDEEGIRKNIERLLTLEGYEVATAPNGHHGLVIARSMLPDIVITDINMPVMDGFAMLDAIRHHPELDRCIVIMLTAADERDSMRRGMRLGADDYLTKPFRRDELLDAIKSQLKKLARFNREKANAVAKATVLTEEKTRELFMEQFAGNSTPGSSFSGYGPQSGNGQAHHSTAHDLASTNVRATVMFADIRNFTTMAERLSAAELAELLGHYFELACRPVVAHGGSHLKMLGDGLLALFEEDSGEDQQEDSHAHRALAAAIGLQESIVEFRRTVDTQYSPRGLPAFDVGIGLHSGEVMLSRLGGADSPEITALGDCVNIASRLQVAGKELGWTVVASMDTAQLAGTKLRRGRQELISLRGREKPVAACEVLGFSVDADQPTAHSKLTTTRNRCKLQQRTTQR
jgi:serine/threonine-protein kinase PpkA